MEHDYQLRNGKIVDDAKNPSRAIAVKIRAHCIEIGCARISVEAAKFILLRHKEHFECAGEVVL
jgi:hypothetical protein